MKYYTKIIGDEVQFEYECDYLSGLDYKNLQERIEQFVNELLERGITHNKINVSITNYRDSDYYIALVGYFE